jgi:hypothetical protein
VNHDSCRNGHGLLADLDRLVQVRLMPLIAQSRTNKDGVRMAAVPVVGRGLAVVMIRGGAQALSPAET